MTTDAPAGGEQQGAQDQAGAQQGDGGQPPAQQQQQGQAAPAQQGQAPASPPDPSGYQDFTLPEGTEKDDALLKAFTPVAKSLGLTQEQAQQLVTMQAKHVADVSKAQQEEWEATNETWKQASREDSIVGGVNFDDNLKVAQTALQHYGDKELNEFLDLSGGGNHPAVVRFLYKIGKDMSADRMPSGGGGAGEQPKDAALLLYPTMKQ